MDRLPESLVAAIGLRCDAPTRRACVLAHRDVFRAISAWYTAHEWTADHTGDFDPARKLRALLRYKPGLKHLVVRCTGRSVIRDGALVALLAGRLAREAGGGGGGGVEVVLEVRHNDQLLRRLASLAAVMPAGAAAVRFGDVRVGSDWGAALALVRAVPVVHHLNMYSASAPDGREALDALLRLPGLAGRLRVLTLANHADTHALMAGLSERAVAGLRAVPQLHVTHHEQYGDAAAPAVGTAVVSHALAAATVVHNFARLSVSRATAALLDAFVDRCDRLQQLVLYRADAAGLVRSGLARRFAAALRQECEVALVPACCEDAAAVALVRVLLESRRSVRLLLWRAETPTDELCACLLRCHFRGQSRFVTEGYDEDHVPASSLFAGAGGGDDASSYADLLRELARLSPDVHAGWRELAAPR